MAQVDDPYKVNIAHSATQSAEVGDNTPSCCRMEGEVDPSLLVSTVVREEVVSRDRSMWMSLFRNSFLVLGLGVR